MLQTAKNVMLETYYRMRMHKSEYSYFRPITADDALCSYLNEPHAFWKGVKVRHAEKVVNARKAFADVGIEKSSELSRLLIDKVKKTEASHYRPVFIMGLGGSGSTWLGATLGDLPGLRYGGEIYLPPLVIHAYRRHKTIELKSLIWGIMLLHAWGFNYPDSSYRHEFVNSARSIFQYDILRDIWPEGRYVFLARDPRDQILSVTYRKREYREAIAPGKEDYAYLKSNAKKYMRTFARYKQIQSGNIYFVRYEDLKAGATEEIKKISEAFQLNMSDADIANAVSRNDANRMRSGEIGKKGNLDEGGVAQGWRDEMTEKEKNIVHPIIQSALLDMGYEKGNDW